MIVPMLDIRKNFGQTVIHAEIAAKATISVTTFNGHVDFWHSSMSASLSFCGDADFNTETYNFIEMALRQKSNTSGLYKTFGLVDCSISLAVDAPKYIQDFLPDAAEFNRGVISNFKLYYGYFDLQKMSIKLDLFKG